MMQEFQKAEIPYVPVNEAQLNKKDISEFIVKNYEIPDNDLNNISSFIEQDGELEKIILELPDLIKVEFPNDNIQIRFYEEFREFELLLEIGIFTSFDVDVSFEKEKRLERKLYDLYDWDSADKILIIMEY